MSDDSDAYAQAERAGARAMTTADLLALPATTDLPTAGRALGVSEPVIREQARRGDLDRIGIRVLRIGVQYRVVTSTLLDVLGISTPANETSPDGVDEHRGRRGIHDESHITED